MTFTHDTTLNPIQIMLKSSEGKQNNGTKNSAVSFELNQIIDVPNNVDPYIMCRSMKFTNSFYNINETNNILYYSVNSVIGLGILDIYNIIIPEGNYNITSLIAYLNESLSGIMIISYSVQTFKMTFTAIDESFILRTGENNCLKILGFNNKDTTLTSLITSPNLFNLSGVQMLYISATNLIISSVSSSNSTLNNIIQDINIETLTGTTQNFNNSSAIRYKIINSQINKINIEIFDENNNLVDFNNTEWFMNLSLIFSYKMTFKEELRLNLTTGENTQV